MYSFARHMLNKVTNRCVQHKSPVKQQRTTTTTQTTRTTATTQHGWWKYISQQFYTAYNNIFYKLRCYKTRENAPLEQTKMYINDPFSMRCHQCKMKVHPQCSRCLIYMPDCCHMIVKILLLAMQKQHCTIYKISGWKLHSSYFSFTPCNWCKLLWIDTFYANKLK